MDITFVNKQNIGFLTLSDISRDDYNSFVSLINHLQNIDQPWLQINQSKTKENQLEIIYDFPTDDDDINIINGHFGYGILSKANGQDDIVPGDDIHSLTIDIHQLSRIQLTK